MSQPDNSHPAELFSLVPLPRLDNSHLLVLKCDDQILPMSIGFSEAQAIAAKLNEEEFGRPMTHDLISNLLVGLRGQLDRVEIYKLEDNVFFGYLVVSERSGATEELISVVKIDSRPSDAIALALRADCPILVADAVMVEAGQPLPDEMEFEEFEEP